MKTKGEIVTREAGIVEGDKISWHGHVNLYVFYVGCSIILVRDGCCGCASKESFSITFDALYNGSATYV